MNTKLIGPLAAAIALFMSGCGPKVPPKTLVSEVRGKYISITEDEKLEVIFSDDGQWITSKGDGGKVSFSDGTMMLIGTNINYQGKFYGDAIELIEPKYNADRTRKICLIKDKPTGVANFAMPPTGGYIVREFSMPGYHRKRKISKIDNNWSRIDEYDLDNLNDNGCRSYIIGGNTAVILDHKGKKYADLPSGYDWFKGISEEAKQIRKKELENVNFYQLTEETQEFFGYKCKKVIITRGKHSDSSDPSIITWVAPQHPDAIYFAEIRLVDDLYTTRLETFIGRMPPYGVILKRQENDVCITTPYIFKSRIPQEDFEIPKDYEKVDYETFSVSGEY
jgi:hypothetical protein